MTILFDFGLNDFEKFTPQRWFYAGSIISAATFVGCIGYLTYAFWRSRRQSGKTHYRARR